ncbi:hypothetical protein K4L06_01470 [Lysobacter sp. BMK333-48F3]|uniref:hypothetical protein n=1 Tax=Lysobacter sp. BMK333-48F3 TaxID=2867962 RepID=UPI001C8C6EE6|nr:hypothetical protein [Lysobacter sp. BMK333-48F3]MBX9399963.1 hypothetical protein [Lysobacter sp. BMK333-48F3]
MNVHLIVDAANIDARASRPALGCIYISMDGTDFPSSDWSDFVVVVLRWWLRAVYNLTVGGRKREIVNFMDGPYSVEIEKEADGILRFRALTGDGRRNVFAEAEADAASFAGDLLKRAKAVLAACRESGWTSPDLDELQNSADALERAFATQ